MDSKEKAVILISKAENLIMNAREVMDDKKLFDLSGELLAIDTILCKILKSQRGVY